MPGPAFRMSLYYTAVFTYIGIILPFWPVWLQGQGLDAAEIGYVLAAGMIARAGISPLVASVADRSGRPSRVLVLLGWGTVSGYALYFLATGFIQILGVAILTALMFSAMLPLGDAVTMLKVREGAIDYGRVRLWGSISFILASVGSGYVLAGRPEHYILWMVIAALALTAVCCHLVPKVRTPGTARLSAPLAALFRDRKLVAFLAAASLLQASHGAIYGFGTLHWRAAGHSETLIGALWAEGVIAEICLFAASGRLVARFGPRGLLALAAGAGVVRWLVLGSTTALPALIGVQFLHALTFGATHIAALHFIAREVPASHAATAQSVYSATMVGVLMGLNTVASGWLYGAYGGGAFTAMAGISALGGLILLGTRDRPGVAAP
ncbi:MAG: 3-phenylpropionate MFS transporter [Alphaproteobacteria bacterium]